MQRHHRQTAVAHRREPVYAAAPVTQGRRSPLAGATVLQIVPGLSEGAIARDAVEAASTLVQAGGRAIVAGEGGPLVSALQAAGGEWLPLSNALRNPLMLRRNAQILGDFAAAERVDIVHAVGVSAAWTARAAAARSPMWVVTTLVEAPGRRALIASVFEGAIARGDRIIANSAFAAAPLAERHRLAPGRIAIIPRPIDTDVFAPTAVQPERVAAMRQAWRIPEGNRVILAPGPLAPANGQAVLLQAARAIADAGMLRVTIVATGDTRHRGTVNSLLADARRLGLSFAIRVVDQPRDLPAALAAAHTIVFPATERPAGARLVAQAQAMARPVIVSDLGELPEHVLAPPRMAEDLRTGWVVKAGHAGALGHALREALAMDKMSYQAMAARARQFAEFMFSPQSVAAALRGVYASLLDRDD